MCRCRLPAMVVLRLWQLDRESIHRVRDCDPRLTIETNGEPINHHSYYSIITC